MRSMPKRQQRGEKRRLIEHTARSQPDLVKDGAADRPPQVPDVECKHLIDAVEHHRQHLAHVADDELEPRMAVEGAGQHHAQYVDCRL